jgi:hypothetical protein
MERSDDVYRINADGTKTKYEDIISEVERIKG